MLLLALEWGGTKYSWNSSTIIGLFCGAGATFLLFLGCEHYRREEAMLPLSLFRNRVISCAVIASAMSQGGVYLIFYYLPTWFQVVKGQSPTSSGIYLLPSVGAMSISTALAGALGASFECHLYQDIKLISHSLKDRLLHSFYYCGLCRSSSCCWTYDHA